MRKKRKPGNCRGSRTCFFPIWSRRTSRNSIFNRLTRDTTTCSCRITSPRSTIINPLSLFADNENRNERNKMNNGKLNGKVALVTGGTSGIGKTTAIEFARAGAKVVLTGRREKEGAQVLDEIRKLGGDAAFVRADVAKQNIRINAVAPGVIATDMLDRFAGKEGEMRDSLASITPVGRIGAVEEIAAAVLYLCSDDAKFTTGTSLVVDGGYVAQ